MGDDPSAAELGRAVTELRADARRLAADVHDDYVTRELHDALRAADLARVSTLELLAQRAEDGRRALRNIAVGACLAAVLSLAAQLYLASKGV